MRRPNIYFLLVILSFSGASCPGGNGDGDGGDASISDGNGQDGGESDGGSGVIAFPGQWERDDLNPVIQLECASIVAAADPGVIYDGAFPDNPFRMWLGVPIGDDEGASVLYAESADGSEWSCPQVVFSASQTPGAWDDAFVEIPTVVRDDREPNPDRRYKMWYGGARDVQPRPFFVGLAFSRDGVHDWERLPAAESPYGQEGLVVHIGSPPPPCGTGDATPSAGDAGTISDPMVLKVGDRYHLYYTSFGENILVISHAVSDDGICWTKDPGPVLEPIREWELTTFEDVLGSVVHSTVVFNPDLETYGMWYASFDGVAGLTYTGIGFATSPDGSQWNQLTDPVIFPERTLPGEQIGLAPAPSVLYHDGVWHMWLGGIDNTPRLSIIHLTALPAD